MFKRLLFCLAQICAVWLVFGETTYRDCFEVVPGDLPHIVYSRNKAVDFAIDCMGERGWMVTEHCPRSVSTVINATIGDVVSDQLFTRSYSSVDGGPGSTFTFAFRWKCQANDTTTIYNYGWVTLGTNNGALTIVASEVADRQGVAIVGCPDDDESEEVVARPDISLWKARDQDGWMELVSGCIPRDTEGYVVIPKLIDGKPVRVIGNGAFAGCQRITGVRIPSTVVEISGSAFDGCGAITSMNLPAGLNTIRNSAFYGCVNLRSLTLPADIGTIERYAFPSGTPIVVHLPSSDAERIMRLMRSNPDNPSVVYDPYVALAIVPTEEERKKGTPIWQFCVEEGKAVLDGDKTGDPAIPVTFSGRLEIPSELAGLPVTAIRSHTFAGCEGITSVKIPNTVRAVWPNAFNKCFNIREVEVPSSLEKVEGVIFGDSPDIMTATLPGGEFKVSAFLACPDKLRVLTVAEGSTYVGGDEFIGCPSLISVKFPSTLRSIGPWAFQGCYQLKMLALPEGLHEVGEAAFDGCNELLSVTFPTTLRKIGRYAFSCCKELASLDLPEGLLDVGECAFDGCEKVRTLRIPGSLSVVERDTFRNLNNLKVLTLGEGVRVIGDEAFLCCGELQSVAFPSTLISIGRHAFSDCRKLSVLALPEGLCDVGEEAFDYCQAVRLLTIPGSLSYVGDRAFRNLQGLKTLILSEGVVGIGEEAFRDCCELEKIVFPSTIQFIGRDAFADCSRLNPIQLPEGLLMVDEGAFRSGCDGKTITIPSTLAYIGYGAFCICDDTVVRVAKGNVERISGLFEDAGIGFEEGQIVEEGQLAKSEMVELADHLVAETFTPEFMQDFAALPPGAEVKIRIPNAMPGLLYAVGASATLDGLGQAVRYAQKVEATSEGVELTVVKPEGASCFFRMAVEQP